MFLQPARILDVDGTLADVASIRHFVMRPKHLKDFDAFHAASADVPPHQIALQYACDTVAMGMIPVVVSARMTKWFDVTKGWLDRHMPVSYDGPILRPDGDFRPDVQVKADILRYLRRHYDIRGAIDDNPAVIALWQKHGIPVTVVPGWDMTA